MDTQMSLKLPNPNKHNYVGGKPNIDKTTYNDNEHWTGKMYPEFKLMNESDQEPPDLNKFNEKESK